MPEVLTPELFDSVKANFTVPSTLAQFRVDSLATLTIVRHDALCLRVYSATIDANVVNLEFPCRRALRFLRRTLP